MPGDIPICTCNSDGRNIHGLNGFHQHVFFTHAVMKMSGVQAVKPHPTSLSVGSTMATRRVVMPGIHWAPTACCAGGMTSTQPDGVLVVSRRTVRLTANQVTNGSAPFVNGLHIASTWRWPLTPQALALK